MESVPFRKKLFLVKKSAKGSGRSSCLKNTFSHKKQVYCTPEQNFRMFFHVIGACNLSRHLPAIYRTKDLILQTISKTEILRRSFDNPSLRSLSSLLFRLSRPAARARPPSATPSSAASLRGTGPSTGRRRPSRAGRENVRLEIEWKKNP